MVNYLVTLKEQNGEYEYTHYAILEQERRNQRSAERTAARMVKTWYGGQGKKDGDAVYFDHGMIAVSVEDVHLLAGDQANPDKALGVIMYYSLPKFNRKELN